MVFGLYVLVAFVKGMSGSAAVALTNDALVIKLLGIAVVFALVFFAGHKALQKAEISHYAAYIFLGGLAAILVHILHTSHLVLEQVVAMGNLSIYIIEPAIVGALLGAGYRRVSAFTDVDEDEDVDGLAEAYERQAGHPDGAIDDEAGLIVHGDAAYFEGPLQVRTSVLALIFATIVGCIANVAVNIVFRVGSVARFMEQSRRIISGDQLLIGVLEGTLSGLAYALLTFLPVMFLVLLAHMALRALRQHSYAAYGVAGLLSSPAAMILTGGAAASIGFFAVIPAMVAALVYRKIAGLEPAPVAEDIKARNRRDLVGKNHIRRKVGRVVMSSSEATKAPLFAKKSP
ncbi:MAG: hypothetical protein COA37_18690 [Hoeflea sp.]|nr:MAG: hypothetical protein COA37_18690 [Hoeflea sp.]